MLIDSLRKLKARDKRLTELKADNEALARANTQENGAPNHHTPVLGPPRLCSDSVFDDACTQLTFSSVLIAKNKQHDRMDGLPLSAHAGHL